MRNITFIETVGLMNKGPRRAGHVTNAPRFSRHRGMRAPGVGANAPAWGAVGRIPDRKRSGKSLATAICAAFSLVAGPVLADPTLGCFERSYSAAHLAGQPAQIVARMRLKLSIQPEYGEWIATMDVRAANQGHAKRNGHGDQSFAQFLICWEDGARRGCSVECDGGSFEITKESATSLTFRTDYLLVGETDDCGGALDLAEKQGQPVSYRLNRVDDAVCAGL